MKTLSKYGAVIFVLQVVVGGLVVLITGGNLDAGLAAVAIITAIAASLIAIRLVDTFITGAIIVYVAAALIIGDSVVGFVFATIETYMGLTVSAVCTTIGLAINTLNSLIITLASLAATSKKVAMELEGKDENEEPEKVPA